MSDRARRIIRFWIGYFALAAASGLLIAGLGAWPLYVAGYPFICP